jgi:hypothetical protein
MKSLDYVLLGLGVSLVAVLAAGVTLQMTSRIPALAVLALLGVPGAVMTFIGAIGKGVEIGITASRLRGLPPE